MHPNIEILVDIKTRLGESPVWDVRESRLYWVDGAAGTLFRCSPSGAELRAWDLPCRVGSFALRKSGGVLVALETGLAFLDLASGDVQAIVDPEPNLPRNCLNDGKVDRDGRFVFGTMDQDEKTASGSLYRFDADLTLHKLDSGIICSNGPCWSPDGSTLYFQDSYSPEIRAYDYAADGGVSNRRTFARLDTSSGAADGSTVDEEGFLWNAQIFDGVVVRYAPDGSVDRVIEMPVKKVTSVMFGGAELDILYVTSMGAQLHPHFPPDGRDRGSLFAVHGLGVRGIAERRFEG